MKKKILYLAIFIFVNSCKSSSNEYFPVNQGLKWTYSIKISSSYTGKDYLKKSVIQNFEKKKRGPILEVSRLHSDGSFYTYDVDLKKKKISRSSVILTFKDGLVEPVKKIIYPDSEFNEEQWITREQLFLVKGFQPPLLNVKPESQFDMHYKIKSKFKKYSLKGINYKDCIELYGNGSTSFIGDTRSGPIEVKIINKELICKGVGLIKQIRYENTDASAFGNMSLEKILVNFEN